MVKLCPNRQKLALIQSLGGFRPLVALVADEPHTSRQFWSRSTDISQGGIGLNLLDGEVTPDGIVSLHVPLPKETIGLRASVRYRIG
jgi:hypothetical protein